MLVAPSTIFRYQYKCTVGDTKITSYVVAFDLRNKKKELDRLYVNRSIVSVTRDFVWDDNHATEIIVDREYSHLSNFAKFYEEHVICKPVYYVYPLSDIIELSIESDARRIRKWMKECDV